MGTENGLMILGGLMLFFVGLGMLLFVSLYARVRDVERESRINTLKQDVTQRAIEEIKRTMPRKRLRDKRGRYVSQRKGKKE